MRYVLFVSWIALQVKRSDIQSLVEDTLELCAVSFLDHLHSMYLKKAPQSKNDVIWTPVSSDLAQAAGPCPIAMSAHPSRRSKLRGTQQQVVSRLDDSPTDHLRIRIVSVDDCCRVEYHHEDKGLALATRLHLDRVDSNLDDESPRREPKASIHTLGLYLQETGYGRCRFCATSCRSLGVSSRTPTPESRFPLIEALI
ncbi:uncharacterized protein F5Z01DRAFT_459665 [Emericellopsis atlantica]|uniref:Uncharacterized protein n=1 Tax=Emericellopsis atlantica TaxID=2614577 RepID=A0A9P7ZS00_9HYPO|nr:uncharacterized protein F5Z01DRAFT_459665 [Emericellopsis atlantica]KAG9257229.1 hypothetical protein F5Z01DRAFT_459665 [Emericellopsis atlantica]